MRIKLPGSPKVKTFILAILVVIAVLVIGKTAIDNKKAADLKAQEEQQEQERIAKEEEEARIAEEERQKKQREEELYNNAYNLFHSDQYDEAIKAADDLINEFGIQQSWMSRYPSELSGGELQRYSVLRSLNPKTKFLIADEMTTMLDAVTQVQILDLVIKIIKKRKGFKTRV